MPKLKRRMIFDLLLTVMLVFEMFYQFTGNLLHEIVGFAFFLCIVVHLLLSRRWISSTARSVGKKKMNARRKGLAIMAVLLFIDLLVMIFSSIIISNVLWGFGVDLSFLNPGGIWVPLHSASAYGLCVLVLVHLAMHWVQVAGVMKVEYDPSRRRAIGQCVGAVVGIGAVALGVVGANQVGGSASEAMARMLNTEAEPEETPSSTGDASASQSSSTSAESAARSGSSSRSGSGHTHKRNSSGSSSSGSEGSSSQSGAAESTSPQSSAPESGSGSNGAGTASGVCPLCPKKCSLSAPKCNKPYNEGLI